MKHRLMLSSYFATWGGPRTWVCASPGTYTGHGTTRWLAIANWHQLRRRFGSMSQPAHRPSSRKLGESSN